MAVGSSKKKIDLVAPGNRLDLQTRSYLTEQKQHLLSKNYEVIFGFILMYVFHCFSLSFLKIVFLNCFFLKTVEKFKTGRMQKKKGFLSLK